ncbi:MAG: glycosyltransferase [Pseudotabrizicola sp.]|uniref:glycosyltransferase n=1 Tax=Pseudotabrizicola sp. TaxID=2939647 RepID=UPI002715717F|nr:glycosyltransferase [Pseudotabrizicola sp.]MDO9640494.1 glycosyltransferase [Pseudotabrizicola sp.]
MSQLLLPSAVAPVPVPGFAPPRKADTLGVALLRDGLVHGDALVTALAQQTRLRGRVTDIVLSRAALPPDQMYAALAAHWETSVIDPVQDPPDLHLIDRLGAGACLRKSMLPWRNVGGATVIATAEPEDFDKHLDHLTALFGPVAMAITSLSAVQHTVLALRGDQLVQAAETRVAAAESCRTLGGARLLLPVLALLGLAVALSLVWPLAMLWLLTGWTFLTLLASTLLKAGAGLASGLRPPPAPPPALIARLPTVSVIVALFGESDIAPRLVRRLGKLDYPRERLDIVLVTEADDHMTRAALAEADLPPWMRIVVVPDGQIRTKPRALNFALDHCRGSIIGVYDAEDAPEPDQIRRIVQHFYQRGPEVACLQGVLDFYNPTTNWLSRCFTLEYATWFRIILPGLQRLGLPIPLGGTTLFFRRAALESLGGWDAHNVTEDADLGIRLCRHGYRTELIRTVTAEEANCRPLPWVRQRSRWIKGYMMTWATHMRDPGLLWRQLGPWKFAGFQVLFLCTLSQFVLIPVLWSFWLPWLGLPHPIADALPPMVTIGLIGLLLLTEVVNLTLHLTALHLSGHRFSRWWVLMMHLYFPLGALASYKAAWEVLRKPFFWDKTAHGHFDPRDG